MKYETCLSLNVGLYVCDVERMITFTQVQVCTSLVLRDTVQTPIVREHLIVHAFMKSVRVSE